MQNGELSFTELILNASLLVQLVMFFLVSLSVISWTIIIQRSSVFKRGRQRADEFEDRFWSGIDLNNLYQDCMRRQQDLTGLEVIYASGFKEFVRLVNSGPAEQEVVMDGTYRQMKVAESREIENLEAHLTTLATIGSISPYIGLFGTVWGIMHAFVALAAVKNATLSMVAPPIAEALIATAMGLFAAIPAVMFYNHFAAKCEALENRFDNFMDEFATILNRRLVTVKSQLKREESQHQESVQKPQNSRSEEAYQSVPPMRTVPPRYPENQAGQRVQAPAYQQQKFASHQSPRAFDPRAAQEGPRYLTPGVNGDQERAARQQAQRLAQARQNSGYVHNGETR